MALLVGNTILLNNKYQYPRYKLKNIFVITTAIVVSVLTLGSYAADDESVSGSSQASYTLHPAYNQDLATLTTDDKNKLAEIADQFKNKKIIHIDISGHTDSSLIRARSQGLYADNHALSYSRALNVANYLRQLLKLELTQVKVTGRGSEIPIAENSTAKGRTKNRRVDLVIYSNDILDKYSAPKTITDALTLQNAVRKAIISNPDILIQVNERRSRNEEVEQAEAGYLPTMDLNAGIGTERSRNSTTRASGNKYRTLTRQEGSINVRQMLFDGFATKNEVERQSARVSSSAYTVYGIAENTALDATDAYLNLLRNDTLLKLAKTNLYAHQRTYDQIKIRSDAGVGRRADLEQISGRLALANSNVIAAQSVYDDALTVYVRVVGEAPGDSLIRPQISNDILPSNKDDAIALAIDKHPTLKSAMSDVDATIAQHKAAKHRFFPRFDFELSQTLNSNLDGQVGIDNDTQAMVRMRYNLLSGGADAARRRQTAHLIEESKEVRNRTYRQVVETMRLSWNAYSSTQQQLIYLDDHVKATARTRDAYQKQFNIGQRTLLDLLNSENELFQANQSYIGADYDNLYSRYRILNAQGELLNNLNIDLPKEALIKKNSKNIVGKLK